MKKRILLLSVIMLLIFPNYAWEGVPNYPTNIASNDLSFDRVAIDIYKSLNEGELDYIPFEAALKGYLKLIEKNEINANEPLTVIDFGKSSNTNRLFVIDISSKKIIYKSLVAHGRNSGGEYATSFSNRISSYQSSLGFYRTAETYIGKHGFSLRLDGLETSNSNARARAIVIHGADYVSDSFIKNNGRLGRSLGCPSLPKANYKQIINTIKEGSCLFIYAKKGNYLNNSKLVNSTIESSLSVISQNF